VVCGWVTFAEDQQKGPDKMPTLAWQQTPVRRESVCVENWTPILQVTTVYLGDSVILVGGGPLKNHVIRGGKITDLGGKITNRRGQIK
jgi:hypothetical protein